MMIAMCLTNLPLLQVQILRANAAAGVLLEEIDAELAQVIFLNIASAASAPNFQPSTESCIAC